MTGILDLSLAAGGGGAGALLIQAVTGWLKHRDTVEEHRDQLTFDLLRAAREEMAAMRAEVGYLRPISARALHIEEALDHIEALLNPATGPEREAAERRARAFLRRMRPEIGDLRNTAQTHESAKRIIDDIMGGGNECKPD